jgi:DNA invertase Pin-like site-specific DNA recombinase
MLDVERFIARNGYQVTARYEVTEPVRDGGKIGREYQRTLEQALEGAQAGRFQVLAVWALDQIVCNGAEGALRIIRQFRQRGVIIVSVNESWLNDEPGAQDVLVAFAGWMAQHEFRYRSDQIRAGLARRRAEGKPVGRQPGAVDKVPRTPGGYVASWENGKRRAAHDAKATS